MPERRPATDAVEFAPLEAVIARDPGGRLAAGLARPGQLAGAARALRTASRTLIVSGFPVRAGPGPLPAAARAETDGPPGAKALGDALCSLGGSVRYACPPLAAPLFRALRAEPCEVLDLADDAQAGAALARLDPTHLVAVECPARAADGHYYSLRGEQLTAAVGALDGLFLAAGPERCTVGIGDGGNEVGFGGLRAAVSRTVAHGERIASAVPTRWTLACGVSTWGAYGLVAGLSLVSGRCLLPEPARVRAQLEALVAAGAVDGITKRAEPSIDGMPLEATLALLADLRGLVAPTTG